VPTEILEKEFFKSFDDNGLWKWKNLDENIDLFAGNHNGR
jgi:hypothetical protein